ncbi:MAG TPA: AMP-binding protein, partial [Steroidobacteraceae bacterium]|nr:AMP-binding protein [Steroidobacteraceae bacterium]
MLGLMQQRPLLISSLLDYAERYHAGTEIVSRSVEGPLHRSNWGLIASRARRVANALKRLGVTGSERIATLALNHNRHLEIYFGVTCSGAILHTVNPRLFPDQVRFILDDAEARYVFFDVAFTALIEQIAPRLPNVRGFVALCECSALPSIEVPNLLCYEELLASESDEYAWPLFDENTASALCYTSGTTGNPKGVLYSNRSTVIHALAAAMPDTLNLSARDSILPVVPMFHANAWSLPYACTLVGAKMVF